MADLSADVLTLVFQHAARQHFTDSASIRLSCRLGRDTVDLLVDERTLYLRRPPQPEDSTAYYEVGGSLGNLNKVCEWGKSFINNWIGVIEMNVYLRASCRIWYISSTDYLLRPGLTGITEGWRSFATPAIFISPWWSKRTLFNLTLDRIRGMVLYEGFTLNFT